MWVTYLMPVVVCVNHMLHKKVNRGVETVFYVTSVLTWASNKGLGAEIGMSVHNLLAKRLQNKQLTFNFIVEM